MQSRVEIAKLRDEQRILSEASAQPRQTASKLECELSALKTHSKHSVDELRKFAKTCIDKLQSPAASATKFTCALATSVKLPAIPEEVATSAAPHRCYYRNKRRLIGAAASNGNDTAAALAAARPPEIDVAAALAATNRSRMTPKAASGSHVDAAYLAAKYSHIVWEE